MTVPLSTIKRLYKNEKKKINVNRINEKKTKQTQV